MYVLSFVSLSVALFAVSELVYRLADVLTAQDRPDVLNQMGFAEGIASIGSSLVAGMLFWLLAWGWSLRLYAADTGPDSERDAVLRKVYLYLVLFLAVSWTVWSLGHTLYVLLYWLLVPASQRHSWDVGRDDLIQTASQLFACAVAWAYHARVLGREAAGTSEPHRQATVRWIYSYLVAFVGAATLASGLTVPCQR